MNEVPVLYGILRERGLASSALDVGSEEASALDWKAVRAVLLGASLV